MGVYRYIVFGYGIVLEDEDFGKVEDYISKFLQENYGFNPEDDNSSIVNFSQDNDNVPFTILEDGYDGDNVGIVLRNNLQKIDYKMGEYDNLAQFDEFPDPKKLIYKLTKEEDNFMDGLYKILKDKNIENPKPIVFTYKS